MTRIRSALITGFCLVAGCGIASAPSDPATTDAPPTPRAAAEAANPVGRDAEDVAWHPSMLDAGSLLDNVRDFQGYVGRADIAASGVLTEWNGTKGHVRLDKIIHGQRNEATVPVLGTGGIVRPKVGERVLVLLSPHDGELKLHSFCSYSGMYVYSRELERIIEQAFEKKQ